MTPYVVIFCCLHFNDTYLNCPNIFYVFCCRYALRRDLQVLTLDTRFSFQNGSFINHMLYNHPSLHKLSHFDIAADHMIYNREDFQHVMPKDTVYVSSLREPVNQFTTAINYYRVNIPVILCNISIVACFSCALWIFKQ